MVKKTSPSTPKKKQAQTPNSVTDRDLAAVVSSMLEGLPGVSVQRKVHNVSFLVRKKVFAFTRRDGVVLKLPEETVRGLVSKRQASHLVMGKRVMREWVVIQHNDSSRYREDLDLFQEAIAFVCKG